MLNNSAFVFLNLSSLFRVYCLSFDYLFDIFKLFIITMLHVPVWPYYEMYSALKYTLYKSLFL